MPRVKSKNILATLYSHEPVVTSVMKIGADKLFLLIDRNPDDVQSKAVDRIKDALGSYVDIKVIKTFVYELSKVAEDAIRTIDSIPADELIYLNISGARKTKSLGLMFAGYARADRIHQIIYVTKEDKQIIVLPKFSFDLNKSEKHVLHALLSGEHSTSITQLLYSTKIPRAQFYKALKTLRNKGLVGEANEITEAGRIAVL